MVTGVFEESAAVFGLEKTAKTLKKAAFFNVFGFILLNFAVKYSVFVTFFNKKVPKFSVFAVFLNVFAAKFSVFGLKFIDCPREQANLLELYFCKAARIEGKQEKRSLGF